MLRVHVHVYAYRPAIWCTVLCCSWSCPTWWTVGRQRVRNSRQSLRGETGTVIQCAPCTTPLPPNPRLHHPLLTTALSLSYSPSHSPPSHFTITTLSCHPLSLSPSFLLPPLPFLTTHSWQQGEITNFEYLMELNKLAGRTFNDLMQYPVFPFIVADYKSDELDLRRPESFR